MHYKNGRKVEVGDWVVGVTHNSNHKPVCGIVVELMLEQGPCNIKIHRWEDEQGFNEGIPDPVIPAHETGGHPDYGDAKEFIRVDDGLKMIMAIINHGNHNSLYL